MASKYFFVILVSCFVQFQFAQSAAVHKRGLEIIPFIGPALQEAVNQVTDVTNKIISSLGGGVTQAQDIVQNYTAQAAAASAAAKGPLESLLQTALDEIGKIIGNELQYEWNSTLCAFGQKENVENVVLQAVLNTSGCIQAEIRGALELFADIQIINSHAAEVSGSIPGQLFDCVVKNFTNVLGCVQPVVAVTSSKLLLLFSSQMDDLYRLMQGGIQLPDRLAKCGAEQILKATAKVGEIISNVGACVKQVAQNS